MNYRYFLLFICFLTSLDLQSQTVINTPSINKYANVVTIDYCKNTISVPPGMGGQFAIGDKILMIQMKGATLKEVNNANNGKIDDYNNAGNYEINEIKAINSFANDEILFKFEIERAYNISGFVQIVNVPQYEDVVIQNTLTCQAWNGSFGGILSFNATGSVTMNADIDVSGKGFRGGVAEDIGGTNCFGGAGYSGFNCEFALECGAPKGEGIGNRFENLELARAPNANGGGGGNDHNAGGGGGGAFGKGGLGGDRTNGGCNGFGAFGGSKIDYLSLNKMLFSGAGGAGDAGNQTGSFEGTSGNNAGAIVFVSSNNIIANGNKIRSNGLSVTDIAIGDGAGAGGAGGLVVLDVDLFTDMLSVEVVGGNGGDVQDDDSCPGPGGGGSGGTLWLKSSFASLNLSLNKIGGTPGELLIPPCAGSNNGATAGEDGGFIYDFPSSVSNKEFEALTLIAGSDTVICGEGSAPLFAEASASSVFDFEWTWSSGTESDFNFNFEPTFSGNYLVTAAASYQPVFGPLCKETFLINVDIKKPNIDIVASSFYGDTVTIGQAHFINAVVSPLNSDYVYEWNPADKVAPNNEPNAVAIPYETEAFCLTVTDELGCSNTECVTLYVYDASIKAANAFSPNADGLNDTFFPILSEDLNIIHFKIYNRWGDLVFETNEHKAWDGTKNNIKLASDLYIWHVKVKQNLSGKIFEQQGEVSIIR